MTQSNSDAATLASPLPQGTATSPMLEPSGRTGTASPRLHRFAERMHRAIDGVQQRLGSQGGALRSGPAGGSRIREQGDRLREQFNAHPLQSTGIALGTGVLLDRLLLRKPKVRVVKMPVAVQSPARASLREADWHAARWTRAADAHARRVGQAVQQAWARAGTAAGLGIAGTKAAAATLAAKAGTVPLQMRLATQRLLARSHDYGSVAKSGVQAHPLLGLGAVLGASGLLTAYWMRRRQPSPDVTYVTDERGTGMAWRGESMQERPALRDRMAARPVASALVLLGVGALAGAMLRPR